MKRIFDIGMCDLKEDVQREIKAFLPGIDKKNIIAKVEMEIDKYGKI